MAVIHAHKVSQIANASNPKQGILDALGDLSGIDLFHNTVLVATYIRPAKIGSIIRPDSHVDEDTYQSKTGLVVLKGPIAFKDDETNKFYGKDVDVGNWVFYFVGDGKQCIINGVHCRLLEDTHIRGRVTNPDFVF